MLAAHMLIYVLGRFVERKRRAVQEPAAAAGEAGEAEAEVEAEAALPEALSGSPATAEALKRVSGGLKGRLRASAAGGGWLLQRSASGGECAPLATATACP
jgi:hypothetical protein